MLSLHFPLPSIEKRLLILRDKFRNIKNDSSFFTSISFPKSRVFATSENVILVEGEEEEEGRYTGPGTSPETEILLPYSLRHEYMPNHVAVIMDGNVRWARQRGLPSALGHEAGVRALKKLIELCCKWGVRVLTVFAFSCDNWSRPKVEVDFLLKLFEREIKEELENFLRDDIKISVIGDASKLPKSLQKLITEAEDTTKNNSRLQLIIAVSYSGQYDIVQACKNIAYKVKEGLMQPADITKSVLEQELETNCTNFPYPDLLIRTSGELRVSNFLLWQLAYTELFFVRSFWPDFGEAEFVEALRSFQQRQRRHGRRDS